MRRPWGTGAGDGRGANGSPIIIPKNPLNDQSEAARAQRRWLAGVELRVYLAGGPWVPITSSGSYF